MVLVEQPHERLEDVEQPLRVSIMGVHWDWHSAGTSEGDKDGISEEACLETSWYSPVVVSRLMRSADAAPTRARMVSVLKVFMMANGVREGPKRQSKRPRLC